MTIKKRIKAPVRELLRKEAGLGLVETLVAVAILGTAVVAFVVALSGGALAVSEHSGDTIAQGLAQTQMEYTKSYAYDPAGNYPVAPVDIPPGYSVPSPAVGAVPGTDTDIQKITVTVLRDGQTVMTLEGYKLNR